jgi:alpha-N-arabinofuranosidase
VSIPADSIDRRWGAKRAEYGHPEPFKIQYVEIGNEDMFSCTYVYRFPYLYSALKQAYPEITFISTQFNQNIAGDYNKKCNQTVGIPNGAATDLHNYQVSGWSLDPADDRKHLGI